jgi:hypothetical protein
LKKQALLQKVKSWMSIKKEWTLFGRNLFSGCDQVYDGKKVLLQPELNSSSCHALQTKIPPFVGICFGLET